MMIRLVICNCDPEETETLASRLVDEGLAACVNVFSGTRSIYEWDGEVKDGYEDTLLIKTAEETYPELKENLARWHSYDTPEIVSVEPNDVSRAYQKWVVAETTDVSDR